MSVAYRWRGEDGTTQWLIRYPCGEVCGGWSQGRNEANRAIGILAAARSSLVTILPHRPGQEPRAH